MNSPHKIAIIAGQLVIGGAERQLFFWLSNIDKEKFFPIIVTLNPDNGDYWESFIRSMNYPFLCIRKRKNKLLRVIDIVQALHPYKPDLIHGWHLFTSPYAGAAGKILGTKATLGSLRGSYNSYIKERYFSFMTEKLTSAILVNSYAAGSLLIENRKWENKKVFIVPNCVEQQHLDKAQIRSKIGQKWSIPESRILIGSIGRFDVLKKFDVLLKAIAHIINNFNYDIHLLLIGFGKNFEKLKTMVNDYKINDYVTFTGSDPEARKWLGALDIFCFLSVDEGQPNVVMESAAAGVPIIAWNLPFLQELLTNEQSGYLIEPENEEKLIKGILFLIENPEFRNNIGLKAKFNMSSNYSISKFCNRLTKVYDNLLA